MEKRGYLVYVHQESLCIKIFGVVLQFGLNEKYKRVNLSKSSKYEFQEYEYVSTGILMLSIAEFYCDYPIQRNFADNKNVKLEDRLNEFIIGLIIASQAYLAREKYWEDQRRKNEEQERRKKEILAAIESEKKKIHELKINVKKWHNAKLIREYILQFELVMQDDSLADDKKKEIADYIKLALVQPDRLDPFVVSPSSILDHLVKPEEEEW